MAKKEQVLGQEEINNPTPDNINIIDPEAFNSFLTSVAATPDIGQQGGPNFIETPGYGLENFQKRVPGVTEREAAFSGGLEEFRALNQSRGEKWLNAGGKALGLAGTTLIEGTAGLVYGIGAAAANKDFNSFYDNALAQSLDGFTQWMEENLPNYYSQEEQNMSIPQKLLTANFWADSILKNLGFMAGAYLTGMTAGALVSPALRLGKIAQTSALLREAQLAGTAVAGIEGEALLGELTKAGTKLARRGAANMLITSAVAAKAEAGIEARDLGKTLDMQRDATIENLINSYREEDQKLGTAGINYGEYENLLRTRAEKEFEELKTAAMNTTFAENMAVLTLGNIVQFGKAFGRGYNAERRTLNKIIQNGKGELEQVNPFIKKAANVMGRPLWEMTEEQLQGVSKNSMTEFVNQRSKNAGKADLGMVLDAHMKGMAETYGSQQGWEEGLAGFIMGAIGIPGAARSASGKVTGVKMQGGIWEAIEDNKRKTAATERIVGELNNFAQKGNFNNFASNIIRNLNLEHDKQEFLENGDVFNYKNAEHDQLISDVIAHINAGMLENFLDKAESLKHTPASELRELFSINQEGPNGPEKVDPYSDKTNEELEYFAAQTADKLINYAKKIRDIKVAVESRFPNLASTYGEKSKKDVVETLIHYGSTIDNVDERIEILEDQVGEDLSKVAQSGNLVEINNKIKELEEKNPKEDIRALVEDLSKLYARRKTFVDAYKQGLKGKTINDIVEELFNKTKEEEDDAAIASAADKDTAKWAKNQRDNGNHFRVKHSGIQPTRGNNPVPYVVQVDADGEIIEEAVDDIQFLKSQVKIRQGSESRLVKNELLKNYDQLYKQYIGESIFKGKELSDSGKKRYADNKDEIDAYVAERTRRANEQDLEQAETAPTDEYVYVKVKDLENFEIVDTVTGESTGVSIPIQNVKDQLTKEATYSSQEFSNIVNRHRRVAATEAMLARRQELLSFVESDLNQRTARLEQLVKELELLQNNKTANGRYRHPVTGKVIKKTVALELLATLEKEKSVIESYITQLEASKEELSLEKSVLTKELTSLREDYHTPLKETIQESIALADEQIAAAEVDIKTAKDLLEKFNQAIAKAKAAVLKNLEDLKNVLGTDLYNSHFLNVLEEFVNNDFLNIFDGERIQKLGDRFPNAIDMLNKLAATDPQGEYATLLEAINGLEDALDLIESEYGKVIDIQKIFDSYTDTIKAGEALIKEMDVKKELLQDQINFLEDDLSKLSSPDRLVDHISNKQDVMTTDEVVKSLTETPKVDITNAFSTTTGPRINKETKAYDDERAQRWSLALHQIKDEGIAGNEYTLKVATPESNPEFFNEDELRSHSAVKEVNGIGTIKVQLFKNGEQVLIDNQPVFTALRDVQIEQIGAEGKTISYSNKYGLEPAALGQGIAQYNYYKKQLVSRVNEEGEEVFLPMNGVSRGVPMTEKDAEGNRARHDVKGRIISLEQDYSETPIFLATEDTIITPQGEELKVIPGFAYFIKNGNIVQANLRKLTQAEAETVFNLLVLYAKNQKAHPIFNVSDKIREDNLVNRRKLYDENGELIPINSSQAIKNLVYYNKIVRNLKKEFVRTTGHVYHPGDNRIVVGQKEYKSDPEDLLANKEEIIAHLTTLVHNVNAKFLKENKPYTEVISVDPANGYTVKTKTWNSYREFLLSSERESEPVITTDLVEEGNVQFAALNATFDTEEFIPVSDERKVTAYESRQARYEKSRAKSRSKQVETDEEITLKALNEVKRAAGLIPDETTAKEDTTEDTPKNSNLGAAQSAYQAFMSGEATFTENEDGSITIKGNTVGSTKSASAEQQQSKPASKMGAKARANLDEVKAAAGVGGTKEKTAAELLAEAKAAAGLTVEGPIKSTPDTAPKATNDGAIDLGISEEMEAMRKKRSGEGNQTDTPPRPLQFRKKSLSKTTNKEAIEEVKAWVAQVAPELDFVAVKQLIDGYGMGAFTGMAIKIWEQAEEGTAFHEVFHAMMELYLTPAEVARVVKSFRRSKDYQKKLADIAEKYPEFKGDPVKLEKEALAEDFRSFMLTDGKMKLAGVQRNLFQKLWDFIKFVLFEQPSYVEIVFRNIAIGKYSTRKVISNLRNTNEVYYRKIDNLSAKATKDLFDHMSILFAGLLVEEAGSIGAMFNKDFIKSISLAKIYKEIYADLKRYSKAEAFLATITKPGVWESIVEQHKKYLPQLGLLIHTEETENGSPTDENIIENEDGVDEGVKGRDSLGLVESVRFNTKDGMPNIIKFMFNTAYERTIDSTGNLVPKRNETFGGYTASNFSSLYNFVAARLAYKENFLDMIDQLKVLAEQKPELKAILSFLKADKTNLSFDEFRVQQLFTQQFSKAMMEYDILYFNENGDFYNIDSTSMTVGAKIKNKWKSNYITAVSKGKHPFAKLVGNKIKLDPRTIVAKAEAAKDLKGARGDLAKQELLAVFGITFRDFKAVAAVREFNGIKSPFATAFSKIFNTIAGKYGNLGTLLEDATIFYSSRGELARQVALLANLDAYTAGDEVELQHLNAENNTVYGVTLYNFLSKMRAKFLNGTAFKYYENNPYSASSILLDRARKGNIFEIRIAEGVKAEKSSIQGQTTDNLGITDKIVSSFNNTLLGRYHLIRPGDKSLEYVIVTDEFVSDEDLDTIKPLTIMTDYLVDELLRIVNFHKDPATRNTKAYSAKGGRLSAFDSIITNPKVKLALESVRSEEDIIKILNKNMDAISTDISNYFSKKAAQYEELLLANHVVVLNPASGNYKNIGISSDIIDESTIDEVTFKRLVMRFSMNYFIGNLEQVKLFLGDQAFFGDENSSDIFKRISGAVGTKKNALVDERINNFLNNSIKRLDEKQADGTFKLVVRKDVKVSSDYATEYRKVFVKFAQEELGKTAEQAAEYADELLKPYQNIEEADGQGYMTLDEYREFMLRVGDWTAEHEKVFEKARSGRRLSPKEMFYFQPLKPQYFGPRANSDVFIPTFLKFSIMPLIPAMLENTQMKIVNQNMIENQVGMLVFESAIKVGAPLNDEGVIAPFYDKDGRPNVEFDTIIDLDYNFLGIQVDIAPKVKTEGPIGTQARKLIIGDLIENGELKPTTIFRDGKATTSVENTQQLIDEYNKNWEQIFDNEYQILLEEFGLTKNDDGTFSATNPKNLIKYLRRAGQKRSYSSNVIEAFDSILDSQGKLDLTFDILPNSDKIEQLMLAMTRDRVTKIKAPGGMKIQGASTGFEFSKRKISVDDKWGSNELKFYRQDTPDGKVLKMQVKLPYYFKQMFELGDNESEIPEALRSLVGFRIPTDGLHSIDNIEVVGFLPQEAGDLILLPSEVVAKGGSDFDIDKLTVYFPEVFRNMNTDQLVKTEEGGYDEYVNSSAYYSLLKASNELLPEEMQESVGVAIRIKALRAGKSGTLVDSLESILNDALNEFKNDYNVEELGTSLLSVLDTVRSTIERLDSEIKFNSKVAFNNIIRIMEDVLSAPERFAQLLDPITVEPINKLARYLEFIKSGRRGPINGNAFKDWYERNKNGKALTQTQELEWDNILQVWQDYQGGKNTIGLAANHVVHHVLAQQAGLAFADTVAYGDGSISTELNFKLPKKFNSKSLAHIKNANGEYISSLMSVLANGYLDVAKNPAIFQIGAMSDVASIFFMLARRGVPLDSIVLFMNQQVIQDYLTGRRINKSVMQTAKITSDIDKHGNLEIELASAKMFGNQFTGEDGFSIKYGNNDLINLMQKTTSGEVTKEDEVLEDQIMADFLRYRYLATQLNDVVAASKQDVTLLKNLSDIEVQQKKIEEVLATGNFENVEKLFENTFLKKLKAIQDDILPALSNYFLVHAQRTRDILKPIKDMIYNSSQRAEDASKGFNNINREFITYLLHVIKSPVNGALRGLYQLKSSLLEGDNSVANVVKELQENEDLGYADNLFLQEMIPIFDRNGVVDPTHNIQSNNRRHTVLESNLITASFKELYETGSNTPDSIIRAMLLQSGVSNSPVSFRQLISYEEFARIAKPIIRRYLEGSLGDVKLSDFIDQVFRNNIDNDVLVPFIPAWVRKGVPRVTKSKIINSAGEIETVITEFRVVGVVDTPYIKTRTKIGDKTELVLLKNTGRVEHKVSAKSEYDVTIFVPAVPLGEGLYRKQYHPTIEEAVAYSEAKVNYSEHEGSLNAKSPYKVETLETVKQELSEAAKKAKRISDELNNKCE